jgi:hypothetical protein
MGLFHHDIDELVISDRELSNHEAFKAIFELVVTNPIMDSSVEVLMRS